MNVRELIVELERLPPSMPVVVWGGEDADDWIEVEQALWEDGTSHCALLTVAEENSRSRSAWTT